MLLTECDVTGCQTRVGGHTPDWGWLVWRLDHDTAHFCPLHAKQAFEALHAIGLR